MASSSSSSSSHVPETKYDVFISFRGEDTRNSFLSHLVKEFRIHQIDVYFDESSLHPGNQISSTLLQAIRESSISLIIFSEHYVSSNWCMEELVRIIEWMEQYEQRIIVVPVFYMVDPSDVRHQKGPFGEAFDEEHKDKYKEDIVKIQSWRYALEKAANLSGFHYPSKYKNESELIEEIVKDVSAKLAHIFSSETKGLVGIDKNLESIESLLAIESREVRIIGIWGMGGIGKTTIAEALFNKYSSQYEGCCFLYNIGEESQKYELSQRHGLSQNHGLATLFRRLVSELLQDEGILLKGPSKAQFSNIMRRLSRKKVFIVLDDVNTSEQLEYLTRDEICFGPFSRVIVTTRDKQVLGRVNGIYEAQKLDSENSLQLFCLKAFNKTYPETGFKKLTKMAVDYASGVPLALKVLGSFLYSRSTDVWESELRKLELYPDMKIYNVLKLSYDGLDDLEKNIFLDIVFFFKGEDKNNVIRILDSCGFFAAIGMDNLLRKALITVSNYNIIQMHDLIEQMGREIVRQENKELGKRSRLRNTEDVYDVLKNNKGTDLVEGIVFDVSKTKELHFHADTFKKMPKLRFIKFYSSYDGGQSNVYIPTELESFSNELRYLEWYRYPSKSLPSTFCGEKLVELRMPWSQVSKLWDGMQDLVNLREIDLHGSHLLVELPDFTRASNLKKINLSFCSSLCHVHPSILSIHALEELNLLYCKELKSLKGEIHLKSLDYLEVNGCSSLQEFSVSSDKLRWLDLNQTRIDMLHSSIGLLSKLERFYLSDLGLRTLPNELCFLTSLEELWLPRCEQLIELPGNIKALLRLKTLHLRNCRGLRSLPELPSSIIHLDATNCTSLETVLGLKAVSSLDKTYFSFENCTRLDEHSLYHIMEVAHLTMLLAAFRHSLVKESNLSENSVSSKFNSGKVCYPGSKVPGWFRYKTRQASITIELDQPVNLLGFFLCYVIPQVPSNIRLHHFKCQCYLRDGKNDIYSNRWHYTEEIIGWNPLIDEGVNLDHVYIRYDPFRCDRIMKECCSFISTPKIISLEFISEHDDCFVKEFGICPIYVSETMEEYKDIDELDLSALQKVMTL